MLIESNIFFQKYYPEQLKYRGRFQSFVVYGSTQQQLIRKLLLIAYGK